MLNDKMCVMCAGLNAASYLHNKLRRSRDSVSFDLIGVIEVAKSVSLKLNKE